MPELLDAVADIAEIIEAHADEAEQLRRLPPVTVAALVDAGAMRMLVPARYGGPETAPVDMLRVVAAVSYHDGAAGWCSMISSTTSLMSAFLPEVGAREIYLDKAVVTAGVFAPNGAGTMACVDGVDGVKVTGRWAWGSGAQHSQWIMGGVRCDDETFRQCWFPSSDVSFVDTWHTGGMRGSGSLDYCVSDAFVPLERTIQPGVTLPVDDSPLARFPNFALLACAVAAVGLGVARRALDELSDLAQGKRPQFSNRTLAQSSFTQIEFARAESQLRAAQAFLFDEVDTAWASCEAGEPVTLDQRIGMRLAATNAASACASVADTAYTLAGGSSVYNSSVLGRCMRDAHVVTQHIQTAPKMNEKIGRLLFGSDDDISMF